MNARCAFFSGPIKIGTVGADQRSHRPNGNSMTLTRLFRLRSRCLLALLPANFALGASAEPWPIKQFDVIGVVPEAEVTNLALDDIYRLLQEASITDGTDNLTGSSY